jgi:transposase
MIFVWLRPGLCPTSCGPGSNHYCRIGRCCKGFVVLNTGIGREDLPQELGFGSGMTCWRRLRDWQTDKVFERQHQVLLAELNAAGQIDWSRACVDASHIRAKWGRRHRPQPGRLRQDRS